MASKLEAARALVREKGIVRPADLAARGIPDVYLKRLVEAGELERRARGLYAAVDLDVTAHHTLVETTRLIPRGVFCLLTALAFHELGTQLPSDVWVAIDRKSRRPRVSTARLRIVTMSGRPLSEGVETHRIENTPVKVFNAAKTVADCFRFRNKVGLDVALEALREYRRRRGNRDELWKYARICRVERVMRPYLEALS